MTTPDRPVPARRRAAAATAPARRARTTAVAPLTDDGPTVALQATFEYGTAPNTKEITLNTQDISKLKPGQIQFQLAEPVDLGTLTDFLNWAATTFSFTAPDPSTWPDPFSGIATIDVTIDKLCIDQVNSAYALGVTLTPKTPVKIPIINIGIKQIGVVIEKGTCPAKNGE